MFQNMTSDKDSPGGRNGELSPRVSGSHSLGGFTAASVTGPSLTWGSSLCKELPGRSQEFQKPHVVLGM